MEIASVIIATLALVISLVSIIWQGAKHFSTHKLQMVPLENPFKSSEPGQIGNPFLDSFKELGDSMDADEMERVNLMKQKKGIMT